MSNENSGEKNVGSNGPDHPFTSIIEFRTHSGREADFIRAFNACGMLDRPRAITGFIGGRLLQDRENPMRFTVVATWSTPEAYTEWGAKSQIGANPQALRLLGECIAELTPGRLFKAA